MSSCKQLPSRQIAKLEVEREGTSTERYLLNLGVHCHQHYDDLQIQTWIAKGCSHKQVGQQVDNGSGGLGG